MSPYGLASSKVTQEERDRFYNYAVRYKEGITIHDRVYLPYDSQECIQGYTELRCQASESMLDFVQEDSLQLVHGLIPSVILSCADKVFLNVILLELDSTDSQAKYIVLPNEMELYRKEFGRFALYLHTGKPGDESLYKDFISDQSRGIPAFTVSSINELGDSRYQLTNFIFDPKGITAVSATYHGIKASNNGLHNLNKGVLCHFVLKDEVAGHILFQGRSYL